MVALLDILFVLPFIGREKSLPLSHSLDAECGNFFYFGILYREKIYPYFLSVVFFLFRRVCQSVFLSFFGFYLFIYSLFIYVLLSFYIFFFLFSFFFFFFSFNLYVCLSQAHASTPLPLTPVLQEKNKVYKKCLRRTSFLLSLVLSCLTCLRPPRPLPPFVQVFLYLTSLLLVPFPAYFFPLPVHFYPSYWFSFFISFLNITSSLIFGKYICPSSFFFFFFFFFFITFPVLSLQPLHPPPSTPPISHTPSLPPAQVAHPGERERNLRGKIYPLFFG